MTRMFYTAILQASPRYALACFVSLVFLFGCSNFSNAQQAPLSFGVISALHMPLAETQQKGDKLVAAKGLVPEITQRIAKHLNRKSTQSLLPRNHVVSSLMNGSVDVVCYTTPHWLGIPETSVKWSEPLFENNDILISRPHVKDINTLENLNGKVIGTVKHYKYPLLSPKFDGGQLKRIDASSEKSNFMQLMKSSEIDVVTLNEQTFNYLYKKYFDPKQFPLKVHKLVVEFVQPQCAISRHSSLSEADFNAALSKVKASGFIKAYMKSSH